MSSFLNSSYGVYFPWMLALIPISIAYLIYVYKRKGKGKKIIASSVLILKEIRSKTDAKSKFVPSARFFFDLMLFLLLVLATAGLFKSEKDTEATILIDNSFSMASSMGSNVENSLMLAKESAIKKVKEYPFGTTFKVFVTSPFLQEITNGFIKQKQAIQTISDIKWSYSEDNLQSAVDRLLKINKGKLAIFSDKLPAFNDTSGLVDFVSVGNDNVERSNIAISNISFNKTSKQVVVDIVSYAPVRTLLNIKASSLVDKKGFFYKKEIASKEIGLGSRQSEQVVFDVPNDVAGIVVNAEVKNDFKRFDSISFDNQAWISFKSDRLKALFVSDLTPEEMGIAKIPTVEFKHIKPIEYHADKKDVLEASFVVFHRFSSDEKINRPALIVMPERSETIPVSEEKKNVEITGWDDSHPIMKYLNIATLKELSLKTINEVLGLKEIIRSSSGSVLLAGSVDGNRTVVSAMEIFPYEGKRAPLMSVLTLNIFNWLSSGNISLGYLPVYSKFKKSQTAGEIIKYIDSVSELDSPLNLKDNTFFEVGLVKISQPEKGERFIAINYFNDQESDLSNVQKITIAEQNQLADDNEPKGRTLVPFIIYVLLVLLISDMVFSLWFYRRSRV